MKELIQMLDGIQVVEVTHLVEGILKVVLFLIGKNIQKQGNTLMVEDTREEVTQTTADILAVDRTVAMVDILVISPVPEVIY